MIPPLISALHENRDLIRETFKKIIYLAMDNTYFTYNRKKEIFNIWIFADPGGTAKIAAVFDPLEYKTGGKNALIYEPWIYNYRNFESIEKAIKRTAERIKTTIEQEANSAVYPGLNKQRQQQKIKARDHAALNTLKNWIESEIEFFKMLQVFAADDKQKRKQYAARVSQCRDSILRIDELIATGELSAGNQ